MIERIKQLVRHSAIYSINSAAEKAVGVIILPLMTHYFPPGQYGNWDLLDTSITILAEVLLIGFGAVIILFNNQKEFPYEKKSSFFTLSLFLVLVAIIFTGIVEIFLQYNIAPIHIRPEIVSIIKICSYITVVRLFNNFFFGKLRADERPVYYTITNSVKLFIRTGLIIYFIKFTEHGWEGAFYSALIAEGIIFMSFAPVAFRNMKIKLNIGALKASLAIGAPLMLGSIGFNILNLSDRYVIKLLIGEDPLGIYAVGYRVAGILNMFLVLPYILTLLPATFKVYKQPDDKRYFSKLMTYSAFFFVWGFVALSLFSKEIVRILGQQQSYHIAYIVVPLIALGYVFSGMRMTASLGMMLTKNTKHIASTTLISAALNIILNFIFIPIYGIMAAAVNTLLAYMLFYFLTLYKSSQYYKINYETKKLAVLIATGSVLGSVIYFFPDTSLAVTIIIKLLIIISFPFILYLFHFYEKAELNILSNKEKLFDFIKGIFTKQR